MSDVKAGAKAARDSDDVHAKMETLRYYEAQSARLKPSRHLRFALGFMTVVGCGLVAWPLLPRHYEATSTLILRSPDETGLNSHSQALRQLLDDGAVNSELDVMASLPLTAAVVTRLDLTSDPEFKKSGRGWFGQAITGQSDPVREVLTHLIIARDRKSYTVKLGYWSSDAAQAMRMANALMGAYLDRQVKLKQEANARVVDRLGSRLIELAVREADGIKVASSEAADPLAGSSRSDSRAALVMELAAVRERLVEVSQRQVDIQPDVEVIADAQMPLSAAFPNPVLMGLATFLAALLGGVVVAWPTLKGSLSDGVERSPGRQD